MTPRASALSLITGPTRSGKSRFAEALAARGERAVLYVATARRDPSDAEWSARLAAHRAQRPATWPTIETAHDGIDLAQLVRDASPAQCLIVESLGTWLAALISERLETASAAASHAPALDTVALEAALRERARDLADACEVARAQTIVVAEQTGWGLVPEQAAGRIFSSVLGRLTTALARRAAHAYLVVSGFAIDLHASALRLDIEENL